MLNGGDLVEQIPVNISYRIIELFSAGLYQSPNKAFEELIANSYDAQASVVDTFMPTDMSADGASIWIVDNGESMDLDGLIGLWQIARSPKEADRNDPRSERPVIGKFGIGKLATYILARRLTYVCRQDGTDLAVTMDYDAIDQDEDAEQLIELAARELNADDVAAALAPLRQLPGGSEKVDELLADDGPWTAAAMTDLKPSAAGIQIGRLKWILSTALPMSPRFKLSLNGARVKSSVEKVDEVASWSIGENADLADYIECGSDRRGKYVEIDGLDGRIRGRVEVFADVLTKGKAVEWGRSHGFFVRVRGRLVNLDDPLFGNPALSHSTFNRFRMVVDADGLDGFLASTRENIKDHPAVTNFRNYLKQEFQEARRRYEAWITAEEYEAELSTRIGRTAPSLSRRPLVESVRALVTGEVGSMLLVETPTGIDDPDAFLADLDAVLASDDGSGVISDVVVEFLGPSEFIARYDPIARVVKVNALHPFFANFVENLGRQEPLKLIAVAEVLTEAYLYDERLDSEVIDRVIRRRDAFLRELVSQQREGPAVLAQNLRDQADDADGLEDAVVGAFQSLGYFVTPIGGKGTPDGHAHARLGVGADGVRRDYSFTIDAKSTGKTAVAAKTVGVSTLARHRKDYKANYAIVVAPKFEGGSSRETALGKECVRDSVTPIEVSDLALLVEVAASRMVSLGRLQTLFDCRTATESREWVRALLDEDAKSLPPLNALLGCVADLQLKPDPVKTSVVAYLMRERGHVPEDFREPDVVELVTALGTLAPGYVTLSGDVVTLETSVDRIRKVVSEHYHELPEDLREGYVDEFLEDD